MVASVTSRLQPLCDAGNTSALLRLLQMGLPPNTLRYPVSVFPGPLLTTFSMTLLCAPFEELLEEIIGLLELDEDTSTELFRELLLPS